jgi:hypothetical protein
MAQMSTRALGRGSTWTSWSSGDSATETPATTHISTVRWTTPEQRHSEFIAHLDRQSPSENCDIHRAAPSMSQIGASSRSKEVEGGGTK